MMTAWGVMHSMAADRSGLAGKTITAGTRRRVWGFARPYRASIAAFIVTTVAATFLGLLPPLVIREIFDSAIATGDGGYLNVLFAVLIAAAAGEALLSMAGRRLSSGIGEGLIFDLRLRLFDQVQRMPLAFFTRTQTGTLVSRLNNDVIGAQRAFTGTLGTVVANIITLVATLVTMFLLEWRLTLLAVVILPVFVLPARRVGRGLQAITREGMNLNASMNNTMTERFNVAGALLVKLFGRHDDEAADFSDRAGRVRDIGVRSAMYSQVFLIALTLVGAVGTAIVYWLGGHLAIDGALSAGTLVALGLYTVRIYVPLTSLSNARVDVMSAFVSFERVFEVLDTPNPITDAPDAGELPRPEGRVEFRDVHFAYPTADGTPESLGVRPALDGRRPMSFAGRGATRRDRAPRRERTAPEPRGPRDRRPGNGRGTRPLRRCRAEPRGGARCRPRRRPARCRRPGARRPGARRESAWAPRPAPRCPRTRWRAPRRSRRAGSGRGRCQATSRGGPRTPSETPVLRRLRTRWCRLP